MSIKVTHIEKHEDDSKYDFNTKYYYVRGLDNNLRIVNKRVSYKEAKDVSKQYNVKIKKNNVAIHSTTGKDVNTSSNVLLIKENTFYNIFNTYDLISYDFTKIDKLSVEIIKNTLKKRGIKESCRWVGNNKYIKTSIENADRMTILQYYEKDADLNLLDSFIVSQNIDEKNHYISQLCSREQTSVGIVMLFMLFNALFKEKVKTVYLNASTYDLVTYYSQFGFKLSNDLYITHNFKKDVNKDDIKQIGELNKYIKIISEDDLKQYKTPIGYEMKLNITKEIVNKLSTKSIAKLRKLKSDLKDNGVPYFG